MTEELGDSEPLHKCGCLTVYGEIANLVHLRPLCGPHTTRRVAAEGARLRRATGGIPELVLLKVSQAFGGELPYARQFAFIRPQKKSDGCVLFWHSVNKSAVSTVRNVMCPGVERQWDTITREPEPVFPGSASGRRRATRAKGSAGKQAQSGHMQASCIFAGILVRNLL